jgi:3-dehydroquinate dehydratase / shikimate dehydrogenase
MVQIVDTITAESLVTLRALRDRDTPADLLELRLDGVRDLDVAGALAGRRHPVIVTCRAAWEGGRFNGSEDERLAILTRAAELGAEFVDIEWQADRRALDRCRALTRIVVSHHDFDGVPADLQARIREMRGCGAAVVKVAATARTLGDCLTLKRAFEDEAGSHVAIAMGPAGRLTRLWPAWMGSRWTYAGTAAPGQVSARELADVYRVRQTTAETRAYGVVGTPLGHSASPAMHNAAFAAFGMDAVYLPLETNSAAEFFGVAEAIGLAGASVTIPLKRVLLTASVEADSVTQGIGALNTLRRGPRGWEGRNFDVAGLLAPLQARGLELRGRQAVVLGAGGAARAAVAALRSAGADVGVAARRAEAARALADELDARALGWPPEPGWDLLVNATPVGMWPRVDRSPVEESALRSADGKVVYDLVYNPPLTRLLRLAAAAGARPIGGLEMLVAQACRQFEWWTGRDAPREVMAGAARAFVEARMPAPEPGREASARALRAGGEM